MNLLFRSEYLLCNIKEQDLFYEILLILSLQIVTHEPLGAILGRIVYRRAVVELIKVG